MTDLIGRARTVGLMLTGRMYQGRGALDLGLAQDLTDGPSLPRAMELARRAAETLPLSSFAIRSAVNHARNMSAFDAVPGEAARAGLANTQPEAQARLGAFAAKSAARVRPAG